MGIFYAYAAMYFSLLNYARFDKIGLYLGVILIGLHMSKKINIKIKKTYKRKSVIFSFFILLSGVAMYFAFLVKYNISIFTTFCNFYIFYNRRNSLLQKRFKLYRKCI